MEEPNIPRTKLCLARHTQKTQREENDGSSDITLRRDQNIVPRLMIEKIKSIEFLSISACKLIERLVELPWLRSQRELLWFRFLFVYSFSLLLLLFC